MAVKYITVAYAPSFVSVAARGTDSTIAAIALAAADVTIAADPTALGTITAITAAHPTGNLIVSFDDAVVTDDNKLVKCLEEVIKRIRGSGMP